MIDAGRAMLLPGPLSGVKREVLQAGLFPKAPGRVMLSNKCGL